MRIIIAPNSFKGSLDAFKVANAIKTGLEKSRLKAECHLFPIADGGDHTLEVFHNWLGGDLRDCRVTDPVGRSIMARWLLVRESKTAVIELAKASGISLLREEELDPLRASPYGTGQLIKEAIDHGVQKIILGLGGSATVDGGLGIMQALGAEIYDAAGNLIKANTNPLMEFHDISLDNIEKKIFDTEFMILCDVENPLLGKDGAVHVFAPQKGASEKDVAVLERAMERYSQTITRKAGKDLSKFPGTGAAGGIALVLKAFFNTTIESGVDFLLSNMGFEEKIKDADLLVTAEGKVDSQTLRGKGPFGVTSKAMEYGVPSIILAGRADDIDNLNSGFLAVFPITNGPMSLSDAMKNTAADLESTASQIGNLLSLSKL